jgi:hypothetical protein
LFIEATPRLVHEVREFGVEVIEQNKLSRLGTTIDRELAEEWGVSPFTVTVKRWELGIAPFRPARVPIAWTEERLARLGTASDAQLAKEWGLNMATVGRKRQKLGIAPFDGRETEAARVEGEGQDGGR